MATFPGYKDSAGTKLKIYCDFKGHCLEKIIDDDNDIDFRWSSRILQNVRTASHPKT